MKTSESQGQGSAAASQDELKGMTLTTEFKEVSTMWLASRPFCLVNLLAYLSYCLIPFIKVIILEHLSLLLFPVSTAFPTRTHAHTRKSSCLLLKFNFDTISSKGLFLPPPKYQLPLLSGLTTTVNIIQVLKTIIEMWPFHASLSSSKSRLFFLLSHFHNFISSMCNRGSTQVRTD